MGDAVPQQKRTADLEAPSLFWQCLDEVAASHTAVLRKVMVMMGNNGGAALRAVNRAMRTAVNRTVTTIVCHLESALDVDRDLATVFPEAISLRVAWPPSYTPTAVEAALFLSHICESSPEFLSKIQTLDMFVAAGQADSMVDFLSWCTSLQAASFDYWHPKYGGKDIFQFQGKGSTPDERRTHMQGQLALMQAHLAMLPSSPRFLAPSFWPAYSALTRLDTSRAYNQEQGVLLSAALQTTSLVGLHMDMDDYVSADAYRGLSNLCSLTCLAFRRLPSTNRSQVLAAIATVTSLQTLKVGMSDLLRGTPVEEILGSWSQLSCLKRLRMDTRYAGLQCLTVLQALEQLSFKDDGVFHLMDISLTSLFTLTRLTALKYRPACEKEEWGDVAEAGGTQQGASVVPAAWRQGLVYLQWSCKDSFCIPVVAQLTSLVELRLLDGVVTPELCRVLSKLPYLHDLVLERMSALEAHCPSIARKLLPTLSAKLPPSKPLQLYLMDLCSGDADSVLGSMHVLARWTNIRHPISFTMEYENDYENDYKEGECLAVKGWSVNWLIAADHYLTYGLPLLLIDDADVRLLLDALKGLRRSVHEPLLTVHLGTAISLAAFCSLLSCEDLPCQALTICQAPAASRPYVIGWQGNLQLTTEHFAVLLAMRAPNRSLHRLSLDGCQQLEDLAVVALASAAPELQGMKLRGAIRLGDAALSALAAACPRLEYLEVSGAEGFTAGGVWTFLRGAKALKSAQLGRMGPEAARQLHATVVARSAKEWIRAVFDHWRVHVALCSGVLNFKRRQG